MRKSDLKRFNPRPADVCRIQENSTNAYLTKDRAIEDLLRQIEPRYNSSIQKLRDSRLDQESIFCIAAFVAFFCTCSPGAMRISSGPLRAVVEETAKALDKKGLFGAPPTVLGGKSMTELINSGTVKIDVDSKYPQAVGISNIERLTSTLGNSRWIILRNDNERAAFFTSDYPAAIEVVSDNAPLVRVMALAPDLAVRIVPDLALARDEIDLGFSKLRVAKNILTPSEARSINRLVVRCAEDLVLFRDNEEWIPSFIEKNSKFRVEPEVVSIPHGAGTMTIGRMRIREIVKVQQP
jgi:hypothetical protein